MTLTQYKETVVAIGSVALFEKCAAMRAQVHAKMRAPMSAAARTEPINQQRAKTDRCGALLGNACRSEASRSAESLIFRLIFGKRP